MIDIAQVARFAIQVHDGQLRKYTNMAYAHHLARVSAMTAVATNGDPVSMAAAWLHDSVEDHPDRCSLQTIQALFGGEVQATVAGLTNKSKQIGSTAPRATRKEIDRMYLLHQPYRVKLIKLIDRLDNLQEMAPEEDPEFAILYSDESVLLVEKALHGTNAYLEEAIMKLAKQLRDRAQIKLGRLKLVDPAAPAP